MPEQEPPLSSEELRRTRLMLKADERAAWLSALIRRWAAWLSAAIITGYAVSDIVLKAFRKIFGGP